MTSMRGPLCMLVRSAHQPGIRCSWQVDYCCKAEAADAVTKHVTPGAAPEMLMGRACTEKSDIYSFGVCLWELVMRRVQLCILHFSMCCDPTNVG